NASYQSAFNFCNGAGEFADNGTCYACPAGYNRDPFTLQCSTLLTTNSPMTECGTLVLNGTNVEIAPDVFFFTPDGTFSYTGCGAAPTPMGVEGPFDNKFYRCPAGYDTNVFPAYNAADKCTFTGTSTLNASNLSAFGCPSGTFDGLNGSCYSCPAGYTRDGLNLQCIRNTDANYVSPFQTCTGDTFDGFDGACYSCPTGSRDLLNNTCNIMTVAANTGIIGCAAGSFDGLNGSCYNCPADYTHDSLLTVDTLGVCYKHTTEASTQHSDISLLCPAGTFLDAIDIGVNITDILFNDEVVPCYACAEGYVHNPILPASVDGACFEKFDLEADLVPPKTDGQTCLGIDQGNCESGLVCDISGVCLSPSQCGSAGQRACTIFPLDLARRAEIGGRSCEAGTAEIAGLPDGLLSAFGSTSQCAAVTACGGDGQRACCGGDEKSGFIGACAAGHVEMPNGTFADDNNLCGGLNLTEHQSSGLCVAVTACGGDGQRACCSGSGEFAAGGALSSCQPGLIEAVGCTGDCTCGGFSSNIQSNGVCISAGVGIAEPSTNSTPPSTARENSLSGYADLHIHLHGDLAHGKNLLVGQPAPTGVNGRFLLDESHNISTALSAVTDREIHSAGHGFLIGIGGDLIGKGTGDNAVGNMGVPYFNNWPHWSSTTHQKMYYKWLERAYRGGLRLTVVFAVTNEALCRPTAPAGVDLDARCANSMPAIDEQLAAARDFESFIDRQSGGVGQGWFRIVETPEAARQVIADGKLAVILGIEVDNIFNCKAKVIVEELDLSGHVISSTETGGCPDALLNGETEEEYISRSVDAYYALGVRHVFPVHNFDNAFGSPATWMDTVNVGNRAVEGAYWQVEECPTTASGDFGFKTSAGFEDGFVAFYTGLFGFGIAEPIPLSSAMTSCHASGLNRGQGDSVQIITQGLIPVRRVTFKHDSLGDFLFNKLMDKGMLIDIDHMSIKSVNNTIDIARQRSPHYPLVASHVQFFELNEESTRHERMRTREQLEAISADGGMIAAMLVDNNNAGLKVNTAYTPQTGAGVADDCRHSSKTYAQAYQYAVDVMGGPVALGSDFNGIASQTGPRFGSDACGGRIDLLADEHAERTEEKALQIRAANRLKYPFVLAKPGFDTLSKQVTGEKVFDFNVDGLAHVGLLPDLIKDMQVVGMDASYFDALFSSAEKYIQLWERAESISNALADPETIPDPDAICAEAVSVRAKSGQLQLTWSPINDAAFYTIERSSTSAESGFSTLVTKHITDYATYLDQGLTNGTRYWYRVKPNNLVSQGLCTTAVASGTPLARRPRR
ncbi:MAG: hypothetical protein GQ582_13305, partial [Methyloprofundus sp.]|nr:hypothetical protein [Methyloprofundus sp.]